MHELVLTSSSNEEINSFQFCNSEELQCIIKSIGKEFISGTLQLAKNNSLMFVNVSPQAIQDAYRMYGSKTSEALHAKKTIQTPESV